MNGRAVIVRSFARIHEANLKKQGVLALTFANPDDYERIQVDDTVDIVGLADLAPGRPVEVVIHHADGSSDDDRARPRRCPTSTSRGSAPAPRSTSSAATDLGERRELGFAAHVPRPHAVVVLARGEHTLACLDAETVDPVLHVLVDDRMHPLGADEHTAFVGDRRRLATRPGRRAGIQDRRPRPVLAPRRC